MNVIDRIAQAVQNDADRIMGAYWQAIDKGDWRAAEAMLDRHYGKAGTREDPASVTQTLREQLAAMTPLERLELKRRLTERTVAEIDALGHPELAVIEGEVVSQSPPEDVEHEDAS